MSTPRTPTHFVRNSIERAGFHASLRHAAPAGYTPGTVTAGSFTSLALRPELLEALLEVGYTQMTPIQAETLPTMLANGDVTGQAKTGSGKTAAFGLALLFYLNPWTAPFLIEHVTSDSQAAGHGRAGAQYLGTWGRVRRARHSLASPRSRIKTTRPLSKLRR